jgi:hypothetical protein
MDYAILLAKSGKGDEAKAIYYYGLRRGFNLSALADFEPYPFLVVFDRDENPNATVWEYSTENLVAAAMMAKAHGIDKDQDSVLNEIRNNEPNWVLPIIYQASKLWKGKRRSDLVKLAKALATTDIERTWIKAFEAGENLAKVGLEMRRSSSVLNKAKADLEQIHDKVAIEYKKEG